MDITTKLKQLAFLGIACIVCIAIVKIAHHDPGEAYKPVGQLQNTEDSLASEPIVEPAYQNRSELLSAHRIPTVDDANPDYAVQLAAYDSVHWNSEVITPNRVSTPSSKNNDSTPSTAFSPASGDFSSNPEQRDPEPDAAPGMDPEHEFKPAAESPIAQTKIIARSKPQPSGKRIVGMTRQTSKAKEIKDETPLTATAVTPGFQHGDQLAKISISQTKTPNAKPSPKRITGVHVLPNSATQYIPTQNVSSKPNVSPGKPKRAIVSNPYLNSKAKPDQVAATGPSTVEPHSDETVDNEVNSNSNDFVAGHVDNSTDFNSAIAADSNDFDTPVSTDSNDFEFSEPATSNLIEPASANGHKKRAAQSSPRFEENTSPVSRPRRSVKNDQFTPSIAVAPRSSLNVTNSISPDRKPEPNTLPTANKTRVNQQTPSALLGSDTFVMAEQPKLGDHWNDDRPVTDRRAHLVDPIMDDFSPDPINSAMPYDAYQQIDVYQGKTLNANQRPLIELGRPWYQLGQLSPGFSWLGKHNNVTPQFLVYGDVRSAIASNTQNGDNVSRTAIEVNLDFDLKLTSTERFHMFMAPLDDGQSNAGWLLDESEWVDQYDANIDFGYFEGDIGAMVGGFTNKTLPFDLPIAMGIMPLVLQNGVWMEDAFLGIAATIPARNSPRLNISNMDLTFFAGFDKINSPAFADDDSASKMYGFASFIDALNGHFEIDYAYLEDRTFDDRSYHNIGIGYSRRFGRLFSHSSRIIINTGQSTDVVENSADGVLLLSENSLITGSPSNLVPYMNFFAGFDRPQSAARAVQAGGILRNTGILFETDGMTNYPTLDPTANDTYGGAFGLNLLPGDFSQQLIVEMAALGVMEQDANRNAPGPQYGLAFRYQLPLTNALIFRSDGMYGFLEDNQDVRGLRFELRHKY